MEGEKSFRRLKKSKVVLSEFSDMADNDDMEDDNKPIDKKAAPVPVSYPFEKSLSLPLLSLPLHFSFLKPLA